MFKLFTLSLVQVLDECVIGSACNIHVKSIGLTLDDILHHTIRPNMTLNNQPFSVRMSAAITMVMFTVGLINSIFSLLTFRNQSLRTVGCGMYLLASSVTSVLTICMFTVKFWFVVLTQMNSSVNLSILRGGCKFSEPLLKLFLYLDGWFNACVAVERAVHVLKGVSFDKKKSTRIARWLILFLPFSIIATIIHEPIFGEVFEHTTDISRQEGEEIATNKTVERNVWCVTEYSPSVQDYNTAILFIHLLGPFIANLVSAFFIIFGSARRRSLAQTRQTYKEHIREQWHEHKQLVISPILLLILEMPRLIISLLSGCVDPSRNSWLYLCAYFISFTPSILVFVVFVLPSEMYRKTFRESLKPWQRRIW